MSRKATTKPAVDMTATADMEVIKKASAKSDVHHKQLAEVVEQFGNGQPYDLQQARNEVRFYLNRSGEAMMETGKRLILIKEHEEHGKFLSTLELLGLSVRSSQMLMQIARKLIGELEGIAKLGYTKAVVLAAENTEDLKLLNDGGELAGYTYDEFDRMSINDLKKAIRKAKQKETDTDEVHLRMLEQKDKKINQLDKKLHDVRKHSKKWDYAVKEFNIETTTLAGGLLEKADQLDTLRDAFLTADFGEDNEAATESMAIVYYDAISQIFDKATTLMHDCDEVFGGYKDMAKPMLNA